MLFNSLEYLIFFPIVFVLWWVTVRYARVGLSVLLAASLIFYASWNPWYVLLLLATTVVDFVVGHLLHTTQSPRKRLALIWTSVGYNLGTLAVFKYLNFFMRSLEEAADHGWLPASTLLSWRLDVLLPVGISFFVFQSMSYSIDIYRGELRPITAEPLTDPPAHLTPLRRVLRIIGHYADYLLYVSFFPQLVAGPIVRARDFLPQLRERLPVDAQMAGRGFLLIALGLFKKITIADYLGLNLVDRCFESPAGFSSVEMLVGIYGYAFQIYGDFSGYSDVAIGSALLLGFRFPENFRAPYLAQTLQDFWRRWHISLSSWLRDYLYVSLGGNRRGRWRTYRNLMLTMVLGGLWHGAGWNFLLWGTLHGVALAVLRAIQRRRKNRPILPAHPIGRVLAAVITFHYVCFAWIFFRCATFPEALAVLDVLAQGSTYVNNLPPTVLAALGAALLTHLWPRGGRLGGEHLIGTFTRLPAPLQALLLVGAAFAIRASASSEVVPFIYFQF